MRTLKSAVVKRSARLPRGGSIPSWRASSIWSRYWSTLTILPSRASSTSNPSTEKEPPVGASPWKGAPENVPLAR